MIAASLCDLTTIVRGGVQFEPKSLARFLEFHFAMMNQIAEFAGLAESEIETLSERVNDYYFNR
jgi:hypothetical protein